MLRYVKEYELSIQRSLCQRFQSDNNIWDSMVAVQAQMSGAGTLLSLFGLLPMGSQFREEEAIPKVGITTVGARVAKAVGK